MQQTAACRDAGRGVEHEKRQAGTGKGQRNEMQVMGGIRGSGEGLHDLEDGEARMTFYLDETGYGRQIAVSYWTALKSVWRRQVLANGAQETKVKLKSFWANISVVSALLLGVSYPSAMNPVTVPDNSDQPDAKAVAAAATVFSGVSLILSLMVIVVSVIYLIEIDNATTERDLEDFINANAHFIDILTFVFSGSVVCIFVSAVSMMYITYGATEFWVVMSVAWVVALSTIVFAAIVSGHSRFRLWVRYDSKESKLAIQTLRPAAIKNIQDEVERLKRDMVFQIPKLMELKDLQELKECKDKMPNRLQQGAAAPILPVAGTSSVTARGEFRSSIPLLNGPPQPEEAAVDRLTA